MWILAWQPLEEGLQHILFEVQSWGCTSNKPWEWFSSTQHSPLFQAAKPLPCRVLVQGELCWFVVPGVQLPLLRFCFKIGGAIHRGLSRALMEGTDEAKTLRATLQPQCPQQWGCEGWASHSSVWDREVSNFLLLGKEKVQHWDPECINEKLGFPALEVSWICGFTKLCWNIFLLIYLWEVS